MSDLDKLKKLGLGAAILASSAGNINAQQQESSQANELNSHSIEMTAEQQSQTFDESNTYVASGAEFAAPEAPSVEEDRFGQNGYDMSNFNISAQFDVRGNIRGLHGSKAPYAQEDISAVKDAYERHYGEESGIATDRNADLAITSYILATQIEERMEGGLPVPAGAETFLNKTKEKMETIGLEVGENGKLQMTPEKPAQEQEISKENDQDGKQKLSVRDMMDRLGRGRG